MRPYIGIYNHKKKVCLKPNNSIGPFHAPFHNFHNVSTYVKGPQRVAVINTMYFSTDSETWPTGFDASFLGV